MSIIVDTCIWSIALRHQSKKSSSTTELQKLIEESRVQMLGIIRQELLSGISSQEQYLKLKRYLAAFPDLTVTSEDHEVAAEFFNRCRNKGIQGSAIDFLIAALAVRHKFDIFTNDKDFISYSKCIPIKLHAY